MATPLTSILSSPSGRRVVLIALCFILSAHLIIGFFVNDYRPLKNLIGLRHQRSTQVASLLSTNPDGTPILANATFVMLCRNSELEGVISSIRQIEDRFNKNYRYPWVLLNDEPFTQVFKERVAVITDAPIFFGQVPPEHWNQPEWIDEEKATASRAKMAAQGIIYAGSVPYRNMCRFNSGFFYRHELLQPYRYYWRIEPNVGYFCDLNYDPFRFMQDNNKVYGFTISLVEWPQTIPTLWEAVKEFLAENPKALHPRHARSFVSDNSGRGYNLCHFWSNFEIADMDFWRGETYSKFFEFLESKGGFYYERWGDAPVHSIAVSLFAAREQLHFFNDIGYRHESFQHCPVGEDWYNGRCSCNPLETFDHHYDSCTRKYLNLFPGRNWSEPNNRERREEFRIPVQ